MNIYDAIQLMKQGRFVARYEWPNLTYVFMRGETFMYSSLGIDSVWTPTHKDLVGEDWKEIIPER